MEIPEGFINEIRDDMVEMSGLDLFLVTGTWANNGRVGDINDVVIARNAIEAIETAWAPENNEDLRTIEAVWLCPVESVKKWNDYDSKE